MKILKINLVIHSNKSQNYRLSTMASFQEGNLRGLITTDIMARGLDISNITHVINFEMRRCQNYTCTVSVERVVPIKREQQLVSLHQRRSKVEIEVLMNMELRRSPKFLQVNRTEKSDKSLSF
jgi:ATP-dependent RNA helicase RhlE